MLLTDPAIHNAKPRETLQARRRGGLFLLITLAGGKWWRLKYRFGGKAKLLSLGVYPQVPLKEARERRDEARKQLAAGVDPSEARKAAKAARGGEDSFEAVAREWLAKHAPRWAPGHAGKIIGRFERDIFPWLGARPVREITAPELLEVLRRIEARMARSRVPMALGSVIAAWCFSLPGGRAPRRSAAGSRSARPVAMAYRNTRPQF